jgi:hypothetical protein
LTTLQSSCWIGFHNLTPPRRIVLLWREYRPAMRAVLAGLWRGFRTP